MPPQIAEPHESDITQYGNSECRYSLGPFCWTANKRQFFAGLAVMIERPGAKDMAATIIFPDGPTALKRWTDKRANGSVIKGKNGERALQCRATNRINQSSWGNAKLA